MKPLLSLLLLLAVPAAFAAERGTPRTIRMMPAGVAAHVGPERQPDVQNAEAVVFDSDTGADTYTSIANTPRSYIGMPVSLDNVVGSDIAISKAVVLLVYVGQATKTYSRLRARVQFWDAWTPQNTQVFSNPAADLYEGDMDAMTLEPNSVHEFTLTFDPPIALTGLTSHGVVINWQGDSGSGLVSSDDLSTLLRFGATPFAAGTNPLPNAYGYNGVIHQTLFNYLPSDARTFGEPNEAVVLQLYATAGTFPQRITGFAATPANPVVGGSFTVSATGGATGNPVVFSVDPESDNVCRAGGTNGATITTVGAGTCIVRASQAGGGVYNPAPRAWLRVAVGNPSGLVQDGGFEAGIVPTYWTQASTNFGTPLCDATCTGNWARSGAYWTWLGGAGTRAEVSSIEQTGVISPGTNALNFYLWWASALSQGPDPAATFTVKIDGTTVFTLTPQTAAAYYAYYTRVSIDVSAYANGNSHTVRFESVNAAAAASTNIHLDDINLSRTVSDVIFANGFQ